MWLIDPRYCSLLCCRGWIDPEQVASTEGHPLFHRGSGLQINILEYWIPMDMAA